MRVVRLCLIFALLAVLIPALAQRFDAWNIATNVSAVNAVGGNERTDPFLSKDGLSLFFSCNNCPGGQGGYDLYVAERKSIDEPWGAPINLGLDINTSDSETSPALSVDGHRLYFASNRSGGKGGNDLWVARRHDKQNNFVWDAPENLGEGVNTPAAEGAPSLFEDEATGVTTLYFHSTRSAGVGGSDIYSSTYQSDERFGPSVLVEGVNTSADDANPSVSRDGLVLFLNSNRDGSIKNLKGGNSVDIWMSTRASTSEPWGTPVNVDPTGELRINSGRHEGGAELSFDGTTLVFHAAQRPENIAPGCPGSATCYFNIWMTTRDKITGRAKQE